MLRQPTQTDDEDNQVVRQPKWNDDLAKAHLGIIRLLFHPSLGPLRDMGMKKEEY